MNQILFFYMCGRVCTLVCLRTLCVCVCVYILLFSICSWVRFQREQTAQL